MSKSIEDRLAMVRNAAGYELAPAASREVSYRKQDTRDISNYIDEKPEAFKDFSRDYGIVKNFAARMALPYDTWMNKAKYWMSRILTGEVPFTSLEHSFSKPKDILKQAAERLYMVQEEMMDVEKSQDDFYVILNDRLYKCEREGARANGIIRAKTPSFAEVQELLNGRLTREQKRDAHLYRRSLQREILDAKVTINTEYIKARAAQNTMKHLDHLQYLVYTVKAFTNKVHAEAGTLVEEIERLIPMYDKMLVAMHQGMLTHEQIRHLNNKYVMAVAMTGKLTEQAKILVATNDSMNNSRNNMNKLNSDLASNADGTLDKLVERANNAGTNFRLDDRAEDPEELR